MEYHLIDERGFRVFSVGEEGSPARIQCMFPVSLSDQVYKYIDQLKSGNINPIIEFNGGLKHNKAFVNAVKLYANHPEWLDIKKG